MGCVRRAGRGGGTPWPEFFHTMTEGGTQQVRGRTNGVGGNGFAPGSESFRRALEGGPGEWAGEAGVWGAFAFAKET